MLFPYIYVPHQMEKMQEFIDFIFYGVWCNAPRNGAFRLELFDGNPDLKEVMTAFDNGDTKVGDFFYGHVERIYGLFTALSPAQIDQFQQWYRANNDIEKVCANDPDIHIARYKEIISAYPALGKQLATFFRGLYDKSLLNLVTLREKIGDIGAHNQAFFKVNSIGKCPFCGIGDLKGIHHTRREAYDHYLPKYRYPFNSINFRNLAPACHECNSAYKLSKDPVHNAAGRRKAFYPFAVAANKIEIAVELSFPEIDRLTPADVQLTFGPAAVQEEIDTWREVYGIDERYKAKCCSGDAKNWLEEIRILRDSHRLAPASALNTMQQLTAKAPFANYNFLRKAFLEGCERAGILEALSH